jgi:hypothetical protein
VLQKERFAIEFQKALCSHGYWARKKDNTIEVEGNIVEGKLVLSLSQPALNVSVRDNEIVTPYERIVVRLREIRE